MGRLARPAALPGDARSAGGALRVLVVEGNAIVAMDLADVMESLGYEVVGPVPHCAAARHLLRGTRPGDAPHGALIEFRPDDRDADGLAQLLLATGVPFAWVSSWPADNLPTGPEPALEKPYSRPALGATIALLLDSRPGCPPPRPAPRRDPGVMGGGTDGSHRRGTLPACHG